MNDHRQSTGRIIVCCIFWKSTFMSLISDKCKRRSRNELHLYIAEANSFPSIYCANVSVRSLLCSWLLLCFPMGRLPLKSVPSRGDLYSLLIPGSLGTPKSLSEMASRSVSRFCTVHRRAFLYFTVDHHLPLIIAPSPLEVWGRWLVDPTKHALDGVKVRRIQSWGEGWQVGDFGTRVSPTKMAKPNEMPFGGWVMWAPRTMY